MLIESVVAGPVVVRPTTSFARTIANTTTVAPALTGTLRPSEHGLRDDMSLGADQHGETIICPEPFVFVVSKALPTG